MSEEEREEGIESGELENKEVWLSVCVSVCKIRGERLKQKKK